VNIGERRLVFFQVLGFDGLRYPLAVEWSADRFLVDWESLSAYGTMDWVAFVESRPEWSQTMRVYLAELAENLKPPVDGEGKWSFFRMEHRDSADTVVIAVLSSMAPEITELVRGKRVPVTMEVSWNNEIGQFELVRLVARTWSL